MPADPSEGGRIEVTAMYGAHGERGLVQIQLGRLTVRIEPPKAREIATFLLEAAGAAEADEALMMILGRTTMPKDQQAQVLMAMRQARSVIDRRARAAARAAIAFEQIDPDSTDSDPA